MAAPTKQQRMAKRRAMAGRLVAALVEAAIGQAKVAQAQAMVAPEVDRAMAVSRAIIEGAMGVTRALQGATLSGERLATSLRRMNAGPIAQPALYGRIGAWAFRASETAPESTNGSGVVGE